MHPQELAPRSTCQPNPRRNSRELQRHPPRRCRKHNPRLTLILLSRSEDRRRVWSCIPVVNLMQLRAANDGGTCYQQPKGTFYEVREHCEGGGCRSRGGWIGGLYGYQAHLGGSGGPEGSAGQGAR